VDVLGMLLQTKFHYTKHFKKNKNKIKQRTCGTRKRALLLMGDTLKRKVSPTASRAKHLKKAGFIGPEGGRQSFTFICGAYT
jgi:hypothetical protein